MVNKDGKQIRPTLGHWPEMSLKNARDAALDYKRNDFLPETVAVTVKDICDSWRSLYLAHLSDKERLRKEFFIDKYIVPTIGQFDVKSLTPPIILNQTLRPIENIGYRETAHRVKAVLSQILRHGIAHGTVEKDYTQDLRGILAPKEVIHRPTIIDKAKVAKLMSDIFCYSGSPSVTYALRILPYVFVRPGELRWAEWAEFDFEEKLWRIPAEKMKMKAPHMVPLADQVVDMLRELQEHTGGGKLVFPGTRVRIRPISDVAINAALRYLGYKGTEICGHGFRGMASTLLNEMGYNSDWIERQLAHRERNGVRAAYNHADYLPERRKMMKDWADFLDELRKRITS